MRKSKDPALPFYRELGAAIRHVRTNAKGRVVSQSELAAALDTKPNTISRWESGNFRPSIRDLHAIAHFFGVPVATLIPGAEPLSLHTKLSEAAIGLTPGQILELIHYIEIRKAINKLKRKSPQDVARAVEGALSSVIVEDQ